MNVHHKPLILMAGVGAVGAYFGGRLAVSGQAEIRVICRSDYHEIVSSGYEITSPDGNFSFMPAQVYRSAAECDTPPDYIIVCAKVLPGIDIPAMIAPAVAPGTSIVLIQNGIDIEKDIRQAFPENELISGVAYIGVTRVAPGRIVHTDGGKLKFGVYPQGETPESLALAAMFNAAGVPTDSRADIIRVRWEKLVWNAPFNPVSVLSRANTSQIMNDPDMLKLIRTIMDEVMALAAADGWPLPSDLPDKMLQYTAGFRPYKPSMLIDFEHCRPMEIEAILGNALRAADQFKVATPCLQTVYALLKQLQHNVYSTGE